MGISDIHSGMASPLQDSMICGNTDIVKNTYRDATCSENAIKLGHVTIFLLGRKLLFSVVTFYVIGIKRSTANMASVSTILSEGI